MRGIMYMIPLAYRETCRVLSEHLRQVAANDEKNKMTLRNLELTWSLSVGQMTGAVMRVLAEDATSTPSTLQYRLPLDVAVENAPRGLSDQKPMVPYAVTKLVEYLNENDAFSVSNLFTSDPKSIEVVEDIIYVLNGGSLGVDGAFPTEATPVDAAVALKQWIADIPGSAGIFPDSMRPDFVHAIPPIVASPSPSPAPGEDASSSNASSAGHVNFSQMPDRLEPLFWKLPEPYLQTIKVLLGLLRNWTTFAPEDISSLQAVQALFMEYPLPLQHVLAYLLHNYDMLFADDDSALTAHLQTLVFNSPGNANAGVVGGGGGGANQGFGSPLSPRHLAFNKNTQSSTPSSTTVNTATNSPASGGEFAIAGSTSTTSTTEQHAMEDDEESQLHPEAATAVASAIMDAATSTIAAAGSATPNTASPSGKIKKSKSQKEKTAGSSPSSGKVRKVREAEDELSTTPTRKARTGGIGKTGKASDSPSKHDSPAKRGTSPPKVRVNEDGTPTRRHLKSSSADVESPSGTSKRKENSDMVRSGSKGSTQKGSGSKESSSDQISNSSPPRKPLSRSPSSDDASDDSASNGVHNENGNGADKKVSKVTPKRDKKPRLSREVTDDPELALKKDGDANKDGTRDKVRRTKSSSSAGSTGPSPSPSAEDLSVKKRAPKKREDSDGGASKDNGESNSSSNHNDSNSDKPETNGSAKKKKKKEADMETVPEEGENQSPNVAEAEGASTPKTRKKKSDDTDSPSGGSTEKRKKSEKRSKSSDPTSSNIDSAEPSSDAPDPISSPKKSRKAANAAADDISAIPSTKKASRIKISTALSDA